MDDHSTSEANVNPVDAISELLADNEGETTAEEPNTPEEETTETSATQDSDDADEPSDESTDSDEEEVVEQEEDSEDTESLADMLGVSENQISVQDDGDFLINVKVDGEQSQHKLSDVIKNFQINSSLTNRSQSLAQERRDFDTAVNTKVSEIKETLTQNKRLTELLEHELLAEYDNVDWDTLRVQDPAEWSARRQEYSIKYNRVKRIQDEILQREQATAQQQSTQQLNAKKQHIQREYSKVVENNPEWDTPEKYKAGMNDIMSFSIETYGFKQSDFANVSDSRLIEVLKDAQAYRKGAKVAEKKIIKVPKKMKRGNGRKRAKVSKLDQLTKVAKKAQGSNKKRAQTDAIAELLGA